MPTNNEYKRYEPAKEDEVIAYKSEGYGDNFRVVEVRVKIDRNFEKLLAEAVIDIGGKKEPVCLIKNNEVLSVFDNELFEWTREYFGKLFLDRDLRVPSVRLTIHKFIEEHGVDTNKKGWMAELTDKVVGNEPDWEHIWLIVPNELHDDFVKVLEYGKVLGGIIGDYVCDGTVNGKPVKVYVVSVAEIETDSLVGSPLGYYGAIEIDDSGRVALDNGWIVGWLVTNVDPNIVAKLIRVRKEMENATKWEVIGVDKDRLKQILGELRDGYVEEWKRHKDDVLGKFREFTEILSKDKLNSDDIESLKRIWSSVPSNFRRLFNIFFPENEERRIRMYNAETLKELVRIAKDTNSENFEENLEKIAELMSNARIENVNIATLSSFVAVANPEMFMPITDGAINKQLRSHCNIEVFWGGLSDVQKYRDFIKIVRDIANELEINEMLEVAFYLSKIGHLILEKIGEKFLEKIDIDISEDQLEDARSYYRKLYLPSDIHETIRRYIHLEWLFRGEGLSVGIHIEVPGDVNKNDKVLNILLSDLKSEFDRIAEEVGGKLEICRDLTVYRWIHISKSYSELNEGLEEWAADTMLKMYKMVVPIIREKEEEIKRIIEGNDGNNNSINDLKKKIDQILQTKKQIILYGPPGTGKTWIARNYVKINTNDNRKFYDFVTFHPSYSYEEFVEGIRPKTENGNIYYEVEDGIFKRICREAYNELLRCARINKQWDHDLPELTEDERRKVKEQLRNGNYPKFYLVIDEINRGDISRIFGELITLLEADKRLFAENEITVTLPYSKTKFGVPPNLFIIGTMNTADRSIALIDIALRRRFGFIELMPSYKVLINELGIDNVENEKEAIEKIKRWNENDLNDVKKLAVKVLYTINERIRKLYDRDHQIGHSYLLKLKNCENEIETLKYIWFHEIIPLLQEYFYDSPDKLKDVLKEEFVVLEKDERTQEYIKLYEFKRMEEFDDSGFINALKRLIRGEQSG